MPAAIHENSLKTRNRSSANALQMIMPTAVTDEHFWLKSGISIAFYRTTLPELGRNRTSAELNSRHLFSIFYPDFSVRDSLLFCFYNEDFHLL